MQTWQHNCIIWTAISRKGKTETLCLKHKKTKRNLALKYIIIYLHI